MENDEESYNFCKNLPKIELHAHLNGSLSASILQKLGCSSEDILGYQKLTQQVFAQEKRLQECFSLFKIAHNSTNNRKAVYEATKYVVEEFRADNVIYLELRTTPRREENMTKIDYIEAVVKGIQDAQEGIITKLLLSIDRGHDLKTSEESMDAIIKMKKKYPSIIKGVDFCGNPNVGSFNCSLFKQARDNGLFVTLHCAEVKNNSEVDQILRFEPDRIGHGTFIHPKYGGFQEGWTLYKQKIIPLECCLTSNVLCGTVQCYKEHHLQEWIKNSLPFSLCTDDKGVFGISLSKELALAKKYFELSREHLWKITYDTVDYSFASNEEKKTLKEILEKWKLKNLF
ncbi:hypothetical protein Zmor_020494 [Zophobas morio]|uniref:Adenosine deaminase domain-containing protein n=1 Tax=Zophobas morio TaxID=2755281 RepID=A0AA38I3F4_9CUCU|nr:hypothetical protein Zmor_020494 [Zophobas morio]